MKNQELSSREAEVFADIKKGVLEYPEFAVSLAEKNWKAANSSLTNAGRVYGFGSDEYASFNKKTLDQSETLSIIQSITFGVELSVKEIKHLVHSEAGLEIAKQVANDDFTEVAYNKHMDAQNKTLLSDFKQYATQYPEAVIECASADISWSESEFGKISPQAIKANSAMSAIEDILKGVEPSPSDTKALLESSTFWEVGLVSGISRDTEPTQSTQSVIKEQSHSKLFELSDIPNKEIMDARIHFGTRVSEYAARANGGPYKGEILETDSHLVQLVSSKSIVFHRKSDVTLPDGLQKVNGQELSIYYKEGAAKAYRLDPVKDQLDRTVASLDRAAKGMGLPEVFGEQLAQARNEAWKGIQAARNPNRETKEPMQEQDAPKRSPSR